MFETVTLLGVRVHVVTMAQTLAWVEAAVAARTPRQICTANPEFVMAAQRDREFLDLLNRADLVIPDGVGLLWAARQQGAPIPERVAGSDLIYRLAELGARHGWRLYFLGAAEGVARRAAEALQTRYPGFVLAGTYAGSPRPEDNAALVARVKAAQPDVLMVAYGAPAQDKWIVRNLNELGVPVSMGVGGSFDFVAGIVPRAPLWVQRLNLEWLYRLWKQPRRIGRIFTAVVGFSLTFLWRRWRRGTREED
jgi:N-acetylglucosaminyldiphosphoundecaprenol N-acetyl-beta-D-mannosaminyltransferase